MDVKSQFVGSDNTQGTQDGFLMRSLSAMFDPKPSASEVKFIVENSPNPERAAAWGKKVLGDTQPKTTPTPRRGMGTGFTG